MGRGKRSGFGHVERHHDLIRTVSFSADGRRLVTASNDGTACVWDTKDGHVVATVGGEHQGFGVSARFSPDGKRVVTTSSRGDVRVWDAESGHALAALVGQQGFVQATEFSPDGTLVVTAGWDGTEAAKASARRDEPDHHSARGAADKDSAAIQNSQSGNQEVIPAPKAPSCGHTPTPRTRRPRELRFRARRKLPVNSCSRPVAGFLSHHMTHSVGYRYW